ncbi:MAG: phosphate ABC transporter permease subunit PstC [Pseudomonadota bacterium]
MNSSTLLLTLVGLAILGYLYGRKRSLAVAAGSGGVRHLHSLPSYYGYMTALWAGLPALIALLLWSIAEPLVLNQQLIATLPADVQNLPESQLGLYLNDLKLIAAAPDTAQQADTVKVAAIEHLQQMQQQSSWLKAGLVIVLALAGIAWGTGRVSQHYRARNAVERVVRIILLLCSGIAVATTVGIVLSVLFEALRFFEAVPVTDFLFGLEWSPQTAMRADQVGSSGAFGAVPLFLGTMMIAGIAMVIAVPVGLMTAIYLTQFATAGFRSLAKPMLEILAGIPTVVYGFFAALTVAPLIRNLGESLGLAVASESALAAGVVMGVMIIPFVSSLSDDVINAVPEAMREGSLALGATRSETVRKVIIPAALPGIVGGVLLAVSRAIGETMIVVMAAGLAAKMTANPLDAVTTVTVQIVTLLTGDQEFDSPKTLAAFALGLMLFLTTLLLNVIALHVVRKYREQYE